MIDPSVHAVHYDPGEPPVDDSVAAACDQISDQVCPIDGSKMLQHTEFDEDGDQHCWEECEAPAHHRWPLTQYRGDWYPEPDVVEEKLEEYSK